MLSNSAFPEETNPPFVRATVLWWVLAALIFAVGLGVRLYDLAAPPLDFHATRQLHSALIARGMYLSGRADAPAWQREMAVDQWHLEGQIEPQVFERMTAWSYDLAGGVDLRIPRVYAILFWMIGAVFVVLLARILTGPGGALAAGVFFLAWPYGVISSRAFQPEPLMIALLAAALWAAVRWEQRGGWGWVIAAGLLAGMAIYIKSVAVFFLAPALIVLALARCQDGRRPWRVLLRPQVWLIALLALLPSVMYFVDGVFIRGYLAGQLSQRFFPAMWIDPAFYLRWISNLGRLAPLELILVAVFGALLVRRPAYRALLLAMWAGYFLYGMALPHHITTHDYYHLPLFPQIALGLGAVADALFARIHGPRRLAQAAAGVLLAAILVFNLYEARTVIKRSGASAQAAAWQEIGQALGPRGAVIALVPDYGGGLEYYAWINPQIWPTADDIRYQESLGQSFDFDAFFTSATASRDYFVIAQPDELDSQPRLRELLSARYPVLGQSAGYIIYDLRSPKTGGASR